VVGPEAVAAAPAAEPSWVRQWIEAFVQWLGFATPEQDQVAASQILFQATPSLLGTLLVGLLAYLAIHRNQMRYARDSRRIERARLLHDLDRDYFELMATRAVFVGLPPENRAQQRPWTLEYVLTSAVSWRRDHWDADGNRRVDWINEARFADIAERGTDRIWLDTLTLHLVLGWFKRIDRGLEAGILHPDTVSDLWRNILPWAKANRFNYLNSMFGPRPDGLTVPSAGSAGRLGDRLGARPWRKPASAGELDLPLDLQPVFRVIFMVLARARASGRPEVLDYVADGLDAPLARALDSPTWPAAGTVLPLPDDAVSAGPVNPG